MKERPILFSGPMVRAILEGRKTQTRRIVKPQPHDFVHGFSFELHPFAPSTLRGTPAEGIKMASERKTWVMEDWCNNVVGVLGDCPYGQPGDRLWVRETWHPHKSCLGPASYRATWPKDDESPDGGWRPSIHMPRWASRITLEIVAVKVERLHEITEEDAKAEGVNPYAPDDGRYRDRFKDLWQSINGPGSWDTNPWVWVIEFKRVEEGR